VQKRDSFGCLFFYLSAASRRSEHQAVCWPDFVHMLYLACLLAGFFTFKARLLMMGVRKMKWR
jgi:hypothetical protein